MPVQITCQTCSKVCSFPPSQSNRKYCSDACYTRKGDKNPNWRGGLAHRSCLECESDFQVKHKEVRKGRGNFCSRNCAATYWRRIQAKEHRERRVPKDCIICGKTTLIKPSHVDKGGTYCSKHCMAEGYKYHLKGPGNPNYRHGQAYTPSYYSSQRRASEGSYTNNDIDRIYKGQKGKCANCLCSLKTFGQHIDHIHPICLGGSNWPDNLQLLCPACNHRKHGKHPLEWANENGKLL